MASIIFLLIFALVSVFNLTKVSQVKIHKRDLT